MRSLTIVAAAILSAVWLPALNASAQESREATEAIVKQYLETHPEELGELVKGYFIKHPEAAVQILAELVKRRQAATVGAAVKSGPNPSAAIAASAGELFSSPHQVTLGDPQGDVTLVEFFDYNCGYCKRALADTLALLGDDPHLKLVLKEFPVLGPGSAEAARVAIAARMQDPAKYLAFHQALLGAPGPAGEQKALNAARDQGLDLARLQRDMASDEVSATLAEDMQLASALGISGTPSYVVGDQTIVGAVGVAALRQRIDALRAKQSTAR
jgi:protein-disulfide isomerase